jgi:hypothetical protein
MTYTSIPTIRLDHVLLSLIRQSDTLSRGAAQYLATEERARRLTALTPGVNESRPGFLRS